jgi:heme A synthase
MIAFHQDLFKSVILYFGVLTLWGLFLFIRGQAPSGSYLGALIIGVGLAVVQGLSGVLIVLTTSHHPKEGLHWLYGFVIVLILPVIYGAWAQRSNDRRASLYYALGCALILVIALVRSQNTG